MNARTIATILFALTLFASSAVAQQNQPRKTLDVYVIDVEGGNATLFVSPSGESLLMDTGNVPPGAVRDAGRIMAAIHDAGLTQIDHLIITHWHGDHFGGLAELAPQIPIREFIDHGPNMQPGAGRRRVHRRKPIRRSSPTPTPSTPSPSPATKFAWPASMCSWSPPPAK